MKQIPIRKWDKVVERRYTPLSLSLVIHLYSQKDLNKFIKCKVEDFNLTINDMHYYPEKPLEPIANAQINDYNKKGAKALHRISTLCQKEGKRLVDFTSKLKDKDFSKMSNQELISNFNKIVDNYRNFSPFLIIILCMQKFLDEKLKEIISRRVQDSTEIDDFHKKLSLPIKFNEGQKETISILELTHNFKKENLHPLLEKDIHFILGELNKNKKLKKKIDTHLKKYSWLQVRWLIGEPISFSDLIERIKVLIKSNVEEEIDYMNAKLPEVKSETNKIMKMLKFNKEEKDFVKIVQEYVFLRTFRTDHLSMANYNLIPFLSECAKRINLSYNDVRYLSKDEICLSLKQKSLLKNISIMKRKESWALYRAGEEITIFQGKEEVDKISKEQGIPLLSSEEVKELKGTIAWKGLAKGKAKVLFSPEDLPKVNRGDILVAVMTFPSYISAMEKASAFVTNEGGILCHAAIVAREMKKPCIIATKTATLNIKDNDLVEVDANSGVVRIIK